jgi:hypothetical protein
MTLMSCRSASFVTGGLLASVIVSSFLLMPGCGPSNETGTTVARPKEAEEGERRSREAMKNIMKNRPKPITDPSKRH